MLALVPLMTTADGPLSQAVVLLQKMELGIIKDGKKTQAVFEEYTSWCTKRHKQLASELKTLIVQNNQLQAALDQMNAAIQKFQDKIDDLSSAISTNEADLKAATQIRKSEQKDFDAEEGSLLKMTTALERAIAILERQAQTKSPTMVQIQKARSAAKAIGIMVGASMLRSDDAKALTELIQNSQGDADSFTDSFSELKGDLSPTSRSVSIIETLDHLLEKAKDMLEAARTKEVAAKNNFALLKQSLEDEINFSTEDLAKAKKDLAITMENKATTEGDVKMTSGILVKTKTIFEKLKRDCISKAHEFQASTQSRRNELKAVQEAKAFLKQGTQKTDSLLFIQVRSDSFQIRSDVQDSGSEIKTSTDLANFEAVRFLRNLARKEHDDVLMQLSRRMASAIRYGEAAGENPMSKVKDMIVELIKQLEAEARSEASHKAFCDKELAQTKAKKTEKDSLFDKLTTRIHSMQARQAALEEQVAAAQKYLAELQSNQAEATKIRGEEKATYNEEIKEITEGLQAVKRALQVLREYYRSDETPGHKAMEQAGATVISLLENVETDLAKNAAEMNTQESSSKDQYEDDTEAASREKDALEKDIAFKTKEIKSLKVSITEALGDRDGLLSERQAINEYWNKLAKMCLTTPSSNADNLARRQAEIKGLKEALSILEGESLLIQKLSKPWGRRSLRSSSTKK